MSEHKQYNLVSNEKLASNFSSPQGQDWRSAPNVLETSKSIVIKRTLTANDTEVQQLLGQRWAFSGRATSYTALLTDYVIGIATTTAAYTVSLPKASLAGVGKAYVIKDIGGSAASNVITIDPDGSELLDGDATKGITTDYGSKQIICDGANWYTL